MRTERSISSIWQGKNDYSVQHFNSEQEIAILWRNSSILNVEATMTKVNLRTEEQRNREISKAVDDKSKKFNKNRTVLQQGINISCHQTIFLIRVHFFVSQIRVPLSSLSVSLVIRIENLGWVDTFWDLGKRLSWFSTGIQSRFRGTRTIPCAPVGCGTGHAFRGTLSMPYTHWGSEWQSERAPASRENATRCCVLDSIRQSETEWENAGIRERPKADQRVQCNQDNRGRETEMNRQTTQDSE